MPTLVDLGEVSPGEQSKIVTIPGPVGGTGSLEVGPMSNGMGKEGGPWLEFENLNWVPSPSVTTTVVDFPADGPGTGVRIRAPVGAVEGEYTAFGTATFNCP